VSYGWRWRPNTDGFWWREWNWNPNSRAPGGATFAGNRRGSAKAAQHVSLETLGQDLLMSSMQFDRRRSVDHPATDHASGDY